MVELIILFVFEHVPIFLQDSYYSYWFFWC
jgi:NADH:ubiquinone reductase (non-electrogenic)